LLEWEQPNRFHDWFGSPDFFQGICPPLILHTLKRLPTIRSNGPANSNDRATSFAPQARGGMIARFKKLHRT
jgi:hypothetical protein